MTPANIELLEALAEAGASEEKARAAAVSVAGAGETATKADLARLETQLAASEARLGGRILTAVGVVVAAQALAVAVLIAVLG